MTSALTAEQGGLLTQAVSDLLVQAEATTVLLADIGGNILAQSPARDENHTIAALAAGSFCATRELAVLSGETTFHAVSHEGEQTSIYVQSVTSNYLLLVIFQKTTTLGLVKLYARKSARELRPLLGEIATQTLTAARGGAEFRMANVDEVFEGSRTGAGTL